MKKKNYLLALAALAMVSCSQDEVINDNVASQEAAKTGQITFRTILDKSLIGTRSTNLLTGENINKFKVVCYTHENKHYFGPIDVTKEGDAWTYQGTHNWKGKDKFLRFFAVTGTTNQYFREPTTEEIGSYGKYPFIKDFEIHPIHYLDQTGNYTDSINNSLETSHHGMHDVAMAQYDGRESDGQGNVPLNFYHLMSKISVKAKCDKPATERKVEVMGVRIVNMQNRGTYKLNGIPDVPTEVRDTVIGEWSHTDLTPHGDFRIRWNTKQMPLTLNASAQSILPTGQSFMVFPTKKASTEWSQTNTSGTYLSVICRVTTFDAENRPHIVVGSETKYGLAMLPLSFNIEGGKQYTYTLDFSNGSGQVDPTPLPEPDPDVDPTPPGGGDGGEEYEGQPIKFTVTVEGWGTDNTVEIPPM